MENEQVVKQKFPWGMGIILTLIGFSIFGLVTSLFKMPYYQLGPVITTGIIGTIVVLIIVGLMAVLFYGILKRLKWAKKLAIGWYIYEIVLMLINVVSFMGNQSMYDSYYKKSLPPEGYALMTHSTIATTLFIALIPTLIINTIIIIYLVRKKDFFTK